MDNTYITRSKPINLIAITPNIMECIEGYKLLEANEVMIMDHRSYLVDINFECYFKA